MHPNGEINKHALMIIITKPKEVRFSIRFFRMFFYRRFANATRFQLCKSNPHELENMKNELNNIHIP